MWCSHLVTQCSFCHNLTLNKKLFFIKVVNLVIYMRILLFRRMTGGEKSHKARIQRNLKKEELS